MLLRVWVLCFFVVQGFVCIYLVYGIAESGALELGTEIERLDRRIGAVEDGILKQIDGITTMVQLATLVFVIVAGGFAVFGVGSYLGLMKEIRSRFNEQLKQLDGMRGELESKLAESEKIRQQVQDLVDVQEDLAPATLLAKARNVFEQEMPDEADAARYLSQLARNDTVSSDDLYQGALIAQHNLGNSGLAKNLLRRAKERGVSTYLIEAFLAELSAKDHDWEHHKKLLDDLVGKHPQDSTLLASAANFFIARNDWEGLESNMAKAENLCRWLPLPPRNRAQAAEQLKKEHGIVLDHYERSINNSTIGTDSTSYEWFARYLINGYKPRSDIDLKRAEDLLSDILKVSPDDGKVRLMLAKVKNLQGDMGAAIRELKIAVQFIKNIAARREGAALLASLGEELPVALTDVADTPADGTSRSEA
jgi:hypothetical protein